jgi:hypothetical protein
MNVVLRIVPRLLARGDSIDTDDEGHLFDIWRAVRYSVVVVDYFLDNSVFPRPRQAVQGQAIVPRVGYPAPLHPRKRSPTRGQLANRCLATGFRGTNNNRIRPPPPKEQHALLVLLHTNAEVLMCLFYPRD